MSSIPKRPLKGILKRPKAAASGGDAPPPSQYPPGEARKIAVQHANIIQQKKDAEEQVLNSIIRLIDFPLVREAPYSSTNPAASDAAEFKRLVRTFQPTDYDDLIEERNTCDLCGYSLCARPRKKFSGNGTWKMVNKGREDFKIMPKKELEMWCSEDCARRALYVKVQLLETAAWERVGLPEIKIELFGEDRASAAASGTGAAIDGQLALDIGRLKLEEDRKVAEESAALALERGKVKVKRVDTDNLLEFTIREKTAIAAPVAPSKETNGVDEDGDAHLFLEGYKTRLGGKVEGPATGAADP